MSMENRRDLRSNGVFNFSFFVTLFLILFPLSFIVFQSFYSTFIGEAGHSTLDGYLYLSKSAAFYKTLYNTLLYVVGVIAITVPLALFFAFIIVRTDVPFKRSLDVLMTIPMFISPLILSISWIYLLSPQGYITQFLNNIIGINSFLDIYSFQGVIIVTSLYVLSHSYLFAAAGYSSLDPTFEESSRMSGAGVIRTFFKVTLPLMRPTIVFMVISTFTLVCAMFSVPLILGTKRGLFIFTTYIFQLHISGMSVNITAAACTILLLIAVFTVSMQRKLLGHTSRFVTITPRGFRYGVMRLGPYRYLALIIVSLYIFVSTVLPLGALLHRSFTTGPFDVLTLDNYISVLFVKPVGLRSIRNSIITACVGATVTMALVIVVSYIIYKIGRFKGRVLDYVTAMPAALPGTILGLGLLWAWLRFPLPIYGSLWILIIAYITRFITYGFRYASSALLQVSRDLEEAGRICGSSRVQTIWKILIPLMKRGILGGWMYLFVLMLRELNASVYLFGWGTEVISTSTFNFWEMGARGPLNALGVITVCISLGVFLILRKYGGVKIGA